jgi:hypothetical protein
MEIVLNPVIINRTFLFLAPGEKEKQALDSFHYNILIMVGFSIKILQTSF